MVFYIMNEKKQIIGASPTPFDVPCNECNDEDFLISVGFDNGYYFTDYMQTEEYKELEKEYLNNFELKELRKRREKECFIYINRGALWYSNLSEMQLQELNNWYNAWLDVTKTRIIPDKPEWLL